MGTNAAIGILSENEQISIDSIYCHYDGYLDHTGKTLLKHYNTPALVRELVALGDISGLGNKVGEKHDFGAPPQTEWCTAYHRDRNEPWDSVGTATSGSIQEFLEFYSVEYFYLFVEKENRWYVKVRDVVGVFEPLAEIIECYNEDLTN